MVQFFIKLKEKRKEKNLTQQQMADKLGISLKQYQNYEVKTIPPYEKLLKLNEICDFNFSKILYEQKIPKEYELEDTVNIVSDPLVEYLTKQLERKEEKINELYKKLGAMEKEKDESEDTKLKRAK